MYNYPVLLFFFSISIDKWSWIAGPTELFFNLENIEKENLIQLQRYSSKRNNLNLK